MSEANLALMNQFLLDQYGGDWDNYVDSINDQYLNSQLDPALQTALDNMLNNPAQEGEVMFLSISVLITR